MTRRSAMILVGGAFSLAGLTACDPCFGIGSCDGDPRLSIEGRIVEHTTGQPSSGVRIDLIRVAGIELASDSMSTVTDADGHWQIGESARDVGDVTVDVNVRLQNVASYRVRGLHLSVSDRRGDGLVTPTWVSDPYFAFALELFYRASQDTRVGGATVEFHRTGGIDYNVGSSGQVFTGRTDVAGRLNFFDVWAHATSLGDLIGDIVVHLPAPFAPDTIRGLHLAATQVLHADTQIIRLGVGPPFQSVGGSESALWSSVPREKKHDAEVAAMISESRGDAFAPIRVQHRQDSPDIVLEHRH
jgi:hypothetical protein